MSGQRGGSYDATFLRVRHRESAVVAGRVARQRGRENCATWQMYGTLNRIMHASV